MQKEDIDKLRERDPVQICEQQLLKKKILTSELIEKINLLDLLTTNAAECIYCGIMTDTGSFKFPSTTAKTHRLVGHLIELGADGSKIHQEVYDTYSEDRLRLLGYALTNKMKVFKELNAAYISLSQEELKTCWQKYLLDHYASDGHMESALRYFQKAYLLKLPQQSFSSVPQFSSSLFWAFVSGWNSLFLLLLAYRHSKLR